MKIVHRSMSEDYCRRKFRSTDHRVLGSRKKVMMMDFRQPPAPSICWMDRHAGETL